MPVSNPSAAAAGPQPQAPEIQQLVALLGNLMPLLLRFQSQALEQPFQLGQFQPGPFQANPFQVNPFQVNLGSFPAPNPATIRAIDPQIPPLRAGGQTFSADSTSSIH